MKNEKSRNSLSFSFSHPASASLRQAGQHPETRIPIYAHFTPPELVVFGNRLAKEA